jgi:hypothetical protein
MKTRAVAAASLLAALLPFGAAQAANPCVWVRHILDFKPANDEKSLMLADSPSHKYTVTLVGRCTGLRFAEAIAVRSVGDLFCLTPGDFISFSGAGVPRQCMIDKIEPYVAPKPEGQSQTRRETPPQGY